MPVYEYRCLKCGVVKEGFFHSYEEFRQTACTDCKTGILEKMWSASNFRVVGGTEIFHKRGNNEKES